MFLNQNQTRDWPFFSLKCHFLGVAVYGIFGGGGEPKARRTQVRQPRSQRCCGRFANTDCASRHRKARIRPLLSIRSCTSVNLASSLEFRPRYLETFHSRWFNTCAWLRLGSPLLSQINRRILLGLYLDRSLTVTTLSRPLLYSENFS